MTDQEKTSKVFLSMDMELLKLNPEQIKRIDEMLAEVGEYGEVHIIVQRGELRYINKVESYRLWNGKDEG